jgi:hypothetical protein
VLRLSAAGAAALAPPRPGAPPVPVPSLGAGEARHACALPSGLSLRRAAWHPASEAHLAVLLSDGTLRLYAVPPPAPAAADAPQPRLAREQELALCPEAAPPPGALRAGAPPACPAVDFAFAPSPARSWGALAALVLFQDGALRVLCPAPAPFGGYLPAAHVAAMLADAANDDVAAAWLTAALPPNPADAYGADPAPEASGRAAAAAVAKRMVRVAPHCLHGKAPALQGPLLAPPAGEAAGSTGCGAGAVSLALMAVPGAEDALVVCTACADATLRLWLLLGPLRPAFAPALVTADCGLDGAPRRVRGAACAVPGTPPALVAMDHIITSVGSAPAAACASDPPGLTCALAWECPPGRRLFSAMGARATAVTLTWLPGVQRLLSGRDVGGDFPVPAVEALREGGPPLVGALLLHGALGDAARLLAADARGTAHVLAPAPTLAPPPALSPGAGLRGGNDARTDGGAFSAAAAAADAAAETRADAELEALAAGPPGGGAAPLPRDASARAAPGHSVEGQACLAAAASALRECHVAWAHRAHAELGRRAVRLGSEGARQAEALAALRTHAAQVTQRGAQLAARAERAAALHDNVRARQLLLAELGRAAPRRGASSAAAADAQAAQQLHAWDTAMPGLKGRLKDLGARAAIVDAQQKELRDTGAPPLALPPPTALPPAQLRRLQEALARSGALLAGSVEKVRALRRQLADEE